MYRIERAWNVVPLYDETGFREKYPDVYDLYMRIRNARYTKEETNNVSERNQSCVSAR